MSKTKQLSIKNITRHQSYYRMFIAGCGAFLIAYFAAATLTPVQNSDASTVHITNNTSDYFIDITSADLLELSVTASPSGQLAYVADSVNVTTNSTNGYKLYVSTSGNDNNIYQNGSSSTSSSGYFQATSGTISSPVALTQNTWGFALNKTQSTSISTTFANTAEYVNDTGAPTTSSTWAAVPTLANSDQAKISELTGASNSPNGTDLDIYYGINASTTLPDGSYSTEVTYTAISEGVNSFPTMQDFTSAQCDVMGANTSINLSDSRDDKYYRVTKMADGHCWMTDNLALDGTDKAGNVRVLTTADSNVTQNRTLAPNIENGTPSEYDVVQIYSGVADDVTSSCDLTTNPYCIVNTSTKYGNLYNWNAATAGVGLQATTGTVTESVCPKGWRLPDNAGDFSIANLMGKYSLPTTNGINGTAVQTAQQPPLNFSLAGAYDNSPLYQARGANYWFRTVYASDTNYAYYLYFDAENGNFFPQNYLSKNARFSVRCVFGGQPDEIMQDFTAAQCSALAESTTTVDNRKTMIDSRDGKFYKISKLADGNCWMTSNLALDGMDGLGVVRTITPADSQVNSNTTLAINISDGVDAAYDVVQIYSNYANSTTTTCSYAACVVNNTKYGNVYNWYAATATSGTRALSGKADYSVCPKGWRLPDNTGAKSYTQLLGAYGLPIQNMTSSDAAIPYIQTVQQAPLFFPLAGFYEVSAKTRTFGWSTNYWSRDAVLADTDSVYNFNIDVLSNNYMPQKEDLKYASVSVRCVYGS